MKIKFVSADGANVTEADGKTGDRLLEIAQAHGQALEGTCEGQMACSTCHVIIAPEDFDKLPHASADEDDLLDLAAHVTRTSRLACQILLEESWDSLTVRIPPDAYDMQGR
ncbi:2Fe-2S iron-sulfur cluster-binding protein [Sphingomonas sp.]|uniref:2Fe-2S iron-sulfur cluster-binding protein n=1 Tax=Sphingomonas sp. TaxID=28214 RepID=UPI003B3BBFDF